MGSRPALPPARGGGRRIELVSHPDFTRLHPTPHHPESPERLAVLLERFPDYVEGKAATPADIERCHGASYLYSLRALDEPLWLDGDTYASETSFDAALLAAGCAIEATRRGGFALVRPPGHHALPDRAMGFCLFDNVAVAARYAQAELDAARVAIVDFDVHHGNGTEAIFLDDPSVLFISLHEWPFYPGTGGPGEGNETTINVPLPAGTDDAGYAVAFDEVVEPAVLRFDPDLVLVSAGFDAHEEDPLAMMRLSVDGFRSLAGRCAALAPRTAAVLEGGYNLETLPDLVAAALSGFASTQP